ncbi:MAG: DNA repair protein RecO [Bacteroidales bacterium]|jgi:DNA repair protein RecO (recombination protein O)|nr:DNA repair protein RecO [Bacteroidales bacterium]
MLKKTKAIVLNNIKYKESSIISHLYTEEFGRLSVLVTGARARGKKRGKMAFFQPLSVLDMVIDYKPKRGLQRVREYRIDIPFTDLHFDPVKSTIAMFLSEVLYRVLKEEEKSPDLYMYITTSAQYLDIVEEGYSNFHLLFLMKLTQYLGFYPMFTGYKDGYSFNLKFGVFEPDYNHGLHNLDSDYSRMLYGLSMITYETMDNLKINGKQRSFLLDKVIDYYNLHIDSMGHVNSLDILRQVFA